MSCGSYANRNIRKKNEKAQKEISELEVKDNVLTTTNAPRSREEKQIQEPVV